MPRLHKPNVPTLAPAARARTLTVQTAQRAKKAKVELLVIVPLIALTVFAYLRREELFGADRPVRLIAAVVMVALGWALARDVGRFVAPALFRRMDPRHRRCFRTTSTRRCAASRTSPSRRSTPTR